MKFYSYIINKIMQPNNNNKIKTQKLTNTTLFEHETR